MSAALVLGEALVDVVAGIPHPGGSPLNVAVGLARLGIPTTFHSRLGDDAHGRSILDHLEASGVALTRASRDAAPTSIAEVTVDADGVASYRFSVDGGLAMPDVELADYSIVHSGSIAAVTAPGASVIEDVLQAAGSSATISYDPNIRPALMNESVRDRVTRLIAIADVVKASADDLEWLHPGVPVAEVIAAWLSAGPSVVAITRGREGAMVASRSGMVDVSAPRGPLVDTIGAGDSFMAAMLVALGEEGLLGASQRPALAAISREGLGRIGGFAATCAAITVSRPGADPPYRPELRDDLGRRRVSVTDR